MRQRAATAGRRRQGTDLGRRGDLREGGLVEGLEVEVPQDAAQHFHLAIVVGGGGGGSGGECRGGATTGGLGRCKILV